MPRIRGRLRRRGGNGETENDELVEIDAAELAGVSGGALFGAVGLILAAPVASAIVRISADLARAGGGAETPVTPEVAPT